MGSNLGALDSGVETLLIDPDRAKGDNKFTLGDDSTKQETGLLGFDGVSPPPDVPLNFTIFGVRFMPGLSWYFS